MSRPALAITPREWAALRERLLKFAFYRTKSTERASDLAHDAMRRVIDPDWEPWDPASHPDLLRYMMSIVNRCIANEHSSAAAHREIAMSAHEKSSRAERAALREAEAVPAIDRSPEANVVAQDLASRRLSLLRARLEKKDDALALEVLGLFSRGIDTPAELALALGKPLAEAVKARDRLFYHAGEVAKELDDNDDERVRRDRRDDAGGGEGTSDDAYDDAPDSREIAS